MRAHPCPRCGAMTEGSFSEGGMCWAICEECMRRDRAYRDDIRRQRGYEYGDAVEADDYSKAEPTP